MKLSKISVSYYPTTVFLLDDNKEFLEMLELEISNYMPLIVYDSPKKALKFFNEKYKPSPFINRCIIGDNEESSDHLLQDVDIRSIHKQIYDPRRFSEISVLVVDYAMTDINGLECARVLRQKYPFIKIMMLTGEADQALAVEAFNEGVIDKFIMKDTENLEDLVVKSIKDLQIKYFTQLSEMCFSKTSHFKGVLNCLTDPAFIKVFEKYCEDNKIVEYYLMDNQGSFLLLDKQAKPSWLVVKTEQEMDNLYRHAKFENAPLPIIDALKHRHKMPHFYTDKDLQTPPSEWERFLLNANRLEGNEIYYYAFVNSPTAHDIQSKKVLSYTQYLDSTEEIK